MKRYWTGLLSTFIIIIMILDSRTALQGAKDGLALCLNTVIPSLFPFFVFSAIINTVLIGKSPRFIRPLGRLCGLPFGAESILLLGLVGGYPVGAQTIMEAYKQGAVPASTARRMLGFCNNAGPAFIFGLVSTFFTDALAPWSLWLIQIISAVFVGILLPEKESFDVCLSGNTYITLPQALHQSLRITSIVCGWVILFRVILSFCSRWFLWMASPIGSTIFTGILELSNGCCALSSIENPGIRFVAASGFLSFGGICVCMQTASVVEDLGLTVYLKGKLLQTLISVFLSALLQSMLSPNTSIWGVLLISGISAAIFAIFLRKSSSKTLALGV